MKKILSVGVRERVWRNLKQAFKNNDALYIFGKYIQTRKSKELGHLVRAYYQWTFDGYVYFFEQPGTLFPGETVYDISAGEFEKTIVGFCGEMRHLLYRLTFADKYHLLPRVVWGSGSPYYEPGFNREPNNAFEYYFEPISEASKYPCTAFANIMKSNSKHVIKHNNWYEKSLYNLNEDHIRFLAEAYKKHIHFNETTQKIVSEGIDRILQGNKKVLGIHARGGDFKWQISRHPYLVTADEFLVSAKQEFDSGNYEKLFIATDDIDILKMFKDCFGDDLLFYDDVPRVSGDMSQHMMESKRPMHRYKSGLEILRDIYTLVACESFIGGLSNVSIMVRFVKESLDEQFNKVIVLDKGIRE